MSVTTQKHSGFTIVELLIVIVIIAILAAITIVAYNGIQARARASAASSALTQAKRKLELYKVDNTTYPTTGNLANAGVADTTSATYQYTSTGPTYCLTATSGNVSYYIDSSSQLNPTQGGCNGHTWPGGVAMTNMVSNGDFSGGTTGWGGSGMSVSGGRLVVNNPSAYTGTSQAVGATIIGNKYYFAATVEGGTSIYYGCTNFGPGGILPGTGVQRVSMLATAFQTNQRMWGFYSTTAPVTFYVDNVVLVNLTAAFGAGSEPTKAQMDAILQRYPNSWFDGTVTANTTGIL